MIDRLRRAGYSALEISAGNAVCDAILQEAIAGRDPSHDIQWVYRAAPGQLPPVGVHGSIPLLDALDRAAADDAIDIASRILRFWDHRERFRHEGLGYCSLTDSVPVSLCMSGFVDGAVHAVHLETLDTHRRQGHAMSAASRFVSECLQRGFAVHWDCMASNEASWRLAERLNLHRVAEYRCYSFKL